MAQVHATASLRATTALAASVMVVVFGPANIDNVELLHTVVCPRDIQACEKVSKLDEHRVLEYRLAVQEIGGAVALWSFEDSLLTSEAAIADDIGSHRAFPVDGVTSGARGIVGRAFSFDANGSRVVVDPSPDLNLGDGPLTLTVWFRQDTAMGPNRYVLTKGPGGYDLVIGGNGRPVFEKDGVTRILESTVGVRDTSWHFLAATKAGESAMLYVDARDRTQHIAAAELVDSPSPLYIGSEAQGRTGFPGLIDQIALFRRVLTETEIQRLFVVGQTIAKPTTPGLPWMRAEA